MSDFENAVAQFREAMRRQGESSPSPGWPAILNRDRVRSAARLRWVLAAATAALLLAAIPWWRNAQQRRAAAQDRADELLIEQINASLSQDVPTAMQPLLEPVFLDKESDQ